MNSRFAIGVVLLGSCAAALLCVAATPAYTESETSDSEKTKDASALQSSDRKPSAQAGTSHPPQANLKEFRTKIEPVLKKACYGCHGPKTAKGGLRVDKLNPDLLRGHDVKWWLEVFGAIGNGEMPPADGPKLADADRGRIINWLSAEIQAASQVRRAERGYSSFRRMTRYEYNYALQDLLGLKLDFAKDLPPDPVSKDGFQNSSEVLQMSASQYRDYLELNRAALNRATVRGERPQVLYWGVSAERASAKKFRQPGRGTQRRGRQRRRKRGRRRGSRGGGGAHYKNTRTGQTVPATWSFRRAVNAWAPTTTRPEVPGKSDYIAVLPAGQRLVVELGNRLPDEGTLRVRVRASRVSAERHLVPSLALEFGWQGSNNSKASVKISRRDLVIDAAPGKPRFYQWEIPLSEIYPRNPVRKTVKLGTPKRTNPSEYIRLHNTSLARSADVQFDYVEVTAPVYEQWPPASHTRIFIDSKHSKNENAYAWEIITFFMRRAWRRDVTDAEVERKMKFFARIRPVCEDFQQAVIEVLATVLSSPRFLYLVQSDRSPKQADRTLNQFELATRLSMFLWCSIPDDELLDLAAKGRLNNRDELVRQTKRMLADPRHQRFSKHFVRQWLDMPLLDHLAVNKATYPEFDSILKAAMQQEPIAFFEDVLRSDRSVMDFLHADYALVNQRLARHYGIEGVNGNHFRRVSLKPEDHRGGLLTMAGLLAMNSDGKDSHPLKRGVWLLKNLLNDPPPPPPPAVPEIDLADPEIAKMTLKRRIENHRNHAACRSCHSKIDPWGIAFENFDAVGDWRTKVGDKPVDATSLLFNRQKLDGIHGLKRYLLANRQDQFARAMAHKLTTYALGRPLTFGDRSSIDRLTADLRKNGDGLATLVTLIVTSEIFQSR